MKIYVACHESDLWYPFVSNQNGVYLFNQDSYDSRLSRCPGSSWWHQPAIVLQTRLIIHCWAIPMSSPLNTGMEVTLPQTSHSTSPGLQASNNPLLHTGSHIVTGFQSYELQSQPTSSHLNICNLNVPRLHRERTEQQEEVQLQHPSRNRRGHRPWLNTLLRMHWSTWCIYQITHSDYDYRSICKCHSAIGTRTRCNLGG